MQPRRPTRRRFLKLAAGGLATAAGVGGYTWLVEPHWVQVVRRELPVANLPEALAGRTLVQISDLHVGPVVDDDYIGTAVARACALEPDILVLTGDFMTCHGTEEVDHVARVLQRLRPARLATLAILGNHDYALGWAREDVADRLAPRLRDAGITLLRNAATDVAGLQVAGLDDFWGPRFAPEKVLPSLDPKRAALVLCHNPDAVDQPVWAGYRGWILAGHTHGGQCKPPFLPPPLLPVRNKRYTSGAFDLGDGRHLYINRGLGYLRHVRFNARPEITVFTLTAATA